MTCRRGFSLIELIIAVAIGIVLTGLAVQAMFSIKRMVARAQTLVVLHDEAAVIQREVGRLMQSVHPGGMWRLTVDNPDNAWGTGDEAVKLTWLATVTERTERSYTYGRDWDNDLTWARLTWQAGKAAGNLTREPRLLLGRSRGFDDTAAGDGFTYTDAKGKAVNGTCNFRIYPQPRRDRRRDLNDNDLRFLPNMPPAQYTASITVTGGHGDDYDLDEDAQPLHGPNTRVTACAISWVDRRGHVVGWDSRTANSITALTRDGGATEAVPGATGGWSTTMPGSNVPGATAAVNGIWLDGHIETAPTDPTSEDALRPVLLRLTFSLADNPTPGSTDAELRNTAPSATFTCTLPLDPVLGAP